MLVAVAAVVVVDPIVAGPASAAGTDGQLSVVRIGNDGTFDRVVFEFEGTVAPTVTLNGPRANTGSVPADPSGLPVAVAGPQILTIAMHDAFAAPGYTGPTDFHPTGTANVVEVVQTGDFEGVLNEAIGLNAATTPIVTTLADPVRIVIDIPHATAPVTTTTTRFVTTTAVAATATPTFTG